MICIGAGFFIGLLGIQLFGLPHTNYKFHVIFGLIYACLISISDYLVTLNLHFDINWVDPADKSWVGYLSSLQYKHRFWTMIFNVSVAALLTALGTLGFVSFQVFQKVFGEGFVVNPLAGLLIAVGIGLAWTFFGIFRRIRIHVASIEDAMKRKT